MKKIIQERPKDKTYVVCTENERRVKAKIIEKTDNELKVGLPSGVEMILVKKPKRKLYTLCVGYLEFVSDGWEVY